jgi:CHASE2 domain-containing sensor protein
MGEYVKKKKNMKFQSVDSLQQVVNVVNEAAAALNDKRRTIRESAIPEVLAGALGAGLGAIGSFAALYGLGTVGLSAAGIMSGLATAGGGVSVVLGGAVSASVAGVFVLAAPVAILAASGVGIASYLKHKQLKQEKERLYQEALKKQNAIIKALKDEKDTDKDRINYLKSLNILLQQALKDLKADLGYGA